MRPPVVSGIVALALAAASGDARGAEAVPVAAPTRGALPDVEVVAPALLPGLRVPRDAAPVAVQSAGRALVEAAHPATVADVLDAGFAGVHVASSQGNRFLPDVSFRGMGASPLLGSQSALVVLLDGVRLNESFGDVVLWDLVPMPAVERVDLVPGGGPVFGPNALGGTLQLTTRSGRDLHGVEAGVAAGSFGEREVELAAGGTRGRLDGFVAGTAHDDDGWRDRSPSRVRQLYAKAGWEDEATRVAASYTHAANALDGNALAPESLLARRRAAVYTWPDQARPDLDFWTLEARRAFGVARLDARAYLRRLDVANTSGDAEYDDGGTPSDPADDAYVAESRTGRTRQHTAGGALQVSADTTHGGLRHRVAAGATFDDGRAEYAQASAPGAFTPDRGVLPAGVAGTDTDVATRNRYFGAYVTDTVSPAGERLHVTLAARWDRARVEIADRSGAQPELDGTHEFRRFSPSLGAAWAASPAVTLHASYSQGFRVPTPVELTCASPAAPCALPIAFVADPPLAPVVSRSWETGVRGRVGTTTWRATAYRTTLHDDLLFTSVGAGRGFFANVPATRRQGVELEAGGAAGRLAWRAAYALVEAEYRADVTLFNPVAVAADPSVPATIDVRSGDRLPALPRHVARSTLTWAADDATTVGLSLAYTSSQYLRGDDSNASPPLGGYAVVGLRLERRLSRRLQLELAVDNVLDRRYAATGAYGRNAFDATNEPLTGGPGPVERFVAPGTPRAVRLELRYRGAGGP